MAQGRGPGRVVVETCWYLGPQPSSMVLADASAGPGAPGGSEPSRPVLQMLREGGLQVLWREGTRSVLLSEGHERLEEPGKAAVQ